MTASWARDLSLTFYEKGLTAALSTYQLSFIGLRIAFDTFPHLYFIYLPLDLYLSRDGPRSKGLFELDRGSEGDRYHPLSSVQRLLMHETGDQGLFGHHGPKAVRAIAKTGPIRDRHIYGR